MRHKALVTGSAGLVGSAVTELLLRKQWEVCGIDNDMRAELFGSGASTIEVANEMFAKYGWYRHIEGDIRLTSTYRTIEPVDLIVHCAGQPSHDMAAYLPITDFDINARATLLMLEWLRHESPEATFIYMSTNKVYGDSINRFEFDEHDTRYEPVSTGLYMKGIDEHFPMDQSLHSLFGVSKSAGDLLTQEYGRYFGLKTLCFRCGCLTGGAHRGVKQHGFLAYLAKCVRESIPYTIIGYDGKQVRDNLHANDVAMACVLSYLAMKERPVHGEVYNLGGGRDNSISVVEALTYLEQETGNHIPVEYEPLPRKGDHIWWISNTTKFEEWSAWSPGYSLEAILKELSNE